MNLALFGVFCTRTIRRLLVCARWQVSRSRAASAVMRFLERHRAAIVAAAEREDCQKADASDSEVGLMLEPLHRT